MPSPGLGHQDLGSLWGAPALCLGETAGTQPHPLHGAVEPRRRISGKEPAAPGACSRGSPFRAGSGAPGRRSQIYVQAGGNVPGWEEPAAQPL